MTTSPFLNTRAGLAYVGDLACAGCHRLQFETYRQHPMGRSLFLPADAPPVERFDEAAKNPFRVGPLHFQVLQKGGKLFHKEWCQDEKGAVVAQREEEIAYAIGSGTQARSYLIRRAGALFESPITWYAGKAEWDLSPGYRFRLQHFNRRIEQRCLYCHAQEAHPLEHTMNGYQDPPFGQLAIGCERCHGPGELHVASRKKDPLAEEVDFTIVNPRHLTPALRDAVCEQCHLQGEAIIPRRGRAQSDYRPGLPLHEYVSIFVRPPEAEDPRRIVGHVQQMHQSKCYQKSGGKMSCSSCHDPHGQPPKETKVVFYNDRCRACHSPPGGKAAAGKGLLAHDCSLALPERQASEDNCLFCHMPRSPSSNIEHVAVTDHRVLRHPDRPPKGVEKLRPGELPLVSFHRSLLDPKDAELPRDLALALVYLADQAEADGAIEVSTFLFGRALTLLDQAVARDPHDIPALEARGLALHTHGRLDKALAAFEEVLTKAPDREQTLLWAAEAAEAHDRLEQAEKYCRRLTEKYPYYPGHFERLASLHAKREAWPQALLTSQEAVRLGPFRAQTRELGFLSFLAVKDPSQAQKEFDLLGLLDPAHQAKLRLMGGLKKEK